jgi:hypothetical protein
LLVGIIIGLVIGLAISVPIGARYASVSQQQIIYVTERVTEHMAPQTVYVTEQVTQGSAQMIYLTQQVTQQVTTTKYVTQIERNQTTYTGGNYVLVTYSATTHTGSYGYADPAPGNVFLFVLVTIENHGYEHVDVYSYDFYVVVGSRQFKWSTNVDMNIPSGERLPNISLLNSLSVKGWIGYEVPANYGTFELVWKPSFGQYNVQYVHQ